MATKVSIFEQVDVMAKLWVKGDAMEVAERMENLPPLVSAAVAAQTVEWLQKERGGSFAHGFATMLGVVAAKGMS